MVSKGLGKTGVTIKSRAMVYNAVVQEVILYGREIWVVTDTMMMMLDLFHCRIIICVALMAARKGDGGEWKWASVDMALEVIRFWLIREFMKRLQSKIAEYVAGRPK